MSDKIKKTTVFGVPGQIIGPNTGVGKRVPAERILKQVFVSDLRPINGYGSGGQIQVTIRWDDECGNGRNSFAVTGSIWTTASRREGDIAAGGCLHDDIAKVFPEVAHLIKWHLMYSDGPLHYISNTLYHAGDRDCWGRTKGEPSSFVSRMYELGGELGHYLTDAQEKLLDVLKSSGIQDFQVVEVPCPTEGQNGQPKYGPKYTLHGYATPYWACPFQTKIEATEFAAVLRRGHCIERIPTTRSDGKERDLDAARSTACWPDATDEQLCLPKEELTKLLEARLPALVAEFKQVIADIGFVWGL